MVIYVMHEKDTICAVSTPAGQGGIGIVRVSGVDALSLCDGICRVAGGGALVLAPSHTIHYGHIVEPAGGGVVDEVLITVMRAPRTYTREDVVEINCHGGVAPLRRVLELLIDAGARLAEPGEFTKRAFLKGRIDLAQAEAVMDIIYARTNASLRAANEQLGGGLSRKIAELRERLVGVIAGVEAGVDFPDEDIETPSGGSLEKELKDFAEELQRLVDQGLYGRVLREGIATAIVGRPNVGKSSLLNRLLMQDRAIVTDVPGTTRDVLEEFLNIDGLAIRIVDTAGIRHTGDIVEQEGVRRSLQAIDNAELVLMVLDGSQPLTADDRRVADAASGKAAIAVINKSDLPRGMDVITWPEEQVELSCRTGSGVEELRERISALARKGVILPQEHAWAVNQRHQKALEQAGRSLANALGSVHSGLSPEFVALDLRDALDHLGSVIGAIHSEDILERIFRDFCIGK